MEFRILLLLTVSVYLINAAPMEIQTNIDSSGLNFLARYGYVVRPDPRKGKLLGEKVIADGLKALQRMGGLPETGILDKATKDLMTSPRCGMADFAPTDNAKRKRRYKKHGVKWEKRNLTWALANSNNDDIKDDEAKETLKNAFKKWSSVTNLDFTESKDNPDIWVRFTRAYHNDQTPFDGPGGEIAHAFYPASDDLAGDVHFDDDEHFTVKSSTGRDLMWVSVHEIGHSIGLDHSSTKGAVMYAWYQATEGKDFNLAIDDIRGAQSLYGERIKRGTVVTTPPEPTKAVLKRERRCFDRFQAIFMDHNKMTYVVNGNKAYVMDRRLRIVKGPVTTAKLFGGVEKIDAVFRRQWDNKAVAFSGNKYYVFEDTKLVDGPHYISDGFKGLPADFKDVDAAFVWTGNDQLYIFRADQYWRFSRSPNKNTYRMDYGYPRLIARAWRGVPDNIDSVLTWRAGKTYFFKNDQYYRFNNRKLRVEAAYPRTLWTKCPRELNTYGTASTLSYKSSLLLLIPLVSLILYL